MQLSLEGQMLSCRGATRHRLKKRAGEKKGASSLTSAIDQEEHRSGRSGSLASLLRRNPMVKAIGGGGGQYSFERLLVNGGRELGGRGEPG